MAGRIRPQDIAVVKDRTSIVEVVRDHVTLRSAGIGSLKGLCPFHDEKSPSFTVRESAGTFHCFGCGEGGDVVAFVQKMDHLSMAFSDRARDRAPWRSSERGAWDLSAGGGVRIGAWSAGGEIRSMVSSSAAGRPRGRQVPAG